LIVARTKPIVRFGLVRGASRRKRVDARERRAPRVKIAICSLSIRLFETFDFRRGEGRSGLHPALVKRNKQRGEHSSSSSSSSPWYRAFLRKRS